MKQAEGLHKVFTDEEIEEIKKELELYNIWTGNKGVCVTFPVAQDIKYYNIVVFGMLTGEQMIGRITQTIQYGDDVHLTFQYSVYEFQDFIFDVNNVPKICKLFNVKTVNDTIGRYAYCLLTQELTPIIKGLRLLEPDQDMKKTREIVLK